MTNDRPDAESREPDYGLTELFTALTSDPPESRLSPLGVIAKARGEEARRRVARRGWVLKSAAAVVAVTVLGFGAVAIGKSGGGDTAAAPAMTTFSATSSTSAAVTSAAESGAAEYSAAPTEESPAGAVPEAPAVDGATGGEQGLVKSWSLAGEFYADAAAPQATSAASSSGVESTRVSGNSPASSADQTSSAAMTSEAMTSEAMSSEAMASDSAAASEGTATESTSVQLSSGPVLVTSADTANACAVPLLPKAVLAKVSASLPDGVDAASASKAAVACDLADGASGVSYALQGVNGAPTTRLQLVAFQAKPPSGPMVDVRPSSSTSANFSFVDEFDEQTGLGTVPPSETEPLSVVGQLGDLWIQSELVTYDVTETAATDDPVSTASSAPATSVEDSEAPPPFGIPLVLKGSSQSAALQEELIRLGEALAAAL